MVFKWREKKKDKALAELDLWQSGDTILLTSAERNEYENKEYKFLVDDGKVVYLNSAEDGKIFEVITISVLDVLSPDVENITLNEKRRIKKLARTHATLEGLKDSVRSGVPNTYLDFWLDRVARFLN